MDFKRKHSYVANYFSHPGDDIFPPFYHPRLEYAKETSRYDVVDDVGPFSGESANMQRLRPSLDSAMQFRHTWLIYIEMEYRSWKKRGGERERDLTKHNSGVNFLCYSRV